MFVNGALVHNHLTNDRDELLDSISSVTPAFETTDAQARLLLDYPRIDSFFDAARIEGGDNGYIQEAAPRSTAGTISGNARSRADGIVEDALQRKAQPFHRGLAPHGPHDGRLADLRDEESGSPLEGRKTLVFLSEGFYVNDVRGSLPMLAGQAVARRRARSTASTPRGSRGLIGRDRRRCHPDRQRACPGSATPATKGSILCLARPVASPSDGATTSAAC